MKKMEKFNQMAKSLLGLKQAFIELAKDRNNHEAKLKAKKFLKKFTKLFFD